MTRFLLKLLVAYLYVTNAIGETYRDEECPECEYEDVKPIQVSKQTGYSSPSKKTKSHKSKSATPKQTDSLPTMQEDSQNVDDDAVLWDAYVLELHKKHDKDWKKPKGTKMPKNPKSPAQPDNNDIAYDNANDLSNDDAKPWNIYVSGTQSEEENEDTSNPKRTKTPKAARPTNAPTIVQNENVGTDENPNDADEVESTVTAFLPEFRLTFSLADLVTLRKLRVESSVHHRHLQSLLDVEIYNITYSYFVQSASDSVASRLYLRQSEATIGDESSSTIVSTFQGMLSFEDYSSYLLQNDTQTLLTNLFEENKLLYLSKVRDSSSEALQRTVDVALSFTGKVSTSSGFENGPWYEPYDTADESTNDGDTEVESNNAQNQGGDLDVSIVKSSGKTAVIAGALVGSASFLLFAYAYRRRHRAEKEYAATEFYDQDHGNDFESRASQDECQMSAVVPKKQWNGTRLSDIAVAGPKRNGFSYLEAVVSSSYSSGSSMSKLASGATQEEFARSGMKVDVYGSCKGKKKVSKKRLNKVAILMGKNTPKRNNLTTDLDPIDEVNSAMSGSSVKTPESWQSGNKEINNAPPLLPAMSVSSVPSDETPSNDVSNMNNEKQLAMLSASPKRNISYNTPLAVPPYDSLDMEGMMGNRAETPNRNIHDQISEDTPLHMRCLSFGSASEISDFSSPEKSENGCLNDMSEVINPVYSDSSSEVCAKDMLASINDCASEDSNSQKLSIAEKYAEGNSSVLQDFKIDSTSGLIVNESLCYSQPSYEEDQPKGAMPDLYYSDTSGDVSMLQIERTEEHEKR